MAIATHARIIEKVENHLGWFIEKAIVDGYGPDDNAMWMSSIDLRTGRYPQPDTRPPGIEKRCYRWIDSPMGSNLYWDQPLLVASSALSEVTGNPRYREAGRACVRDFLDRCVARSGLFLWGNHYFYEASHGKVVAFKGTETPVPIDPATTQGELHETRPLPVAWDLFQDIDPIVTERAIREQEKRHLVDTESCEFNRHADRTRGHAFLESGGILATTICWLGALLDDRSLVERAYSIAKFSYEHRDPATGLIPISPTKDRWDMYTCTSEAGMWVGCLQMCGQWCADERFNAMADEVLESWLSHAWDDQNEAYFGKLLVSNGKPVLGEKETPYQPDRYCDLWEPLFPTHDHPFPCAEACVRAWERTGRESFRLGVERWIRMVEKGLPARGGRGAYAEHYGRCIHFLDRAATAFDRPQWRDLADRVEAEAIERLHNGERFRTHPGEERCDAVDGLGVLLLALLERHSPDHSSEAQSIMYW